LHKYGFEMAGLYSLLKKSYQPAVLKGHEFTRAAKGRRMSAALAAGG
jgi:hypothetical protein